jgi:hypothetical protein
MATPVPDLLKKPCPLPFFPTAMWPGDTGGLLFQMGTEILKDTASWHCYRCSAVGSIRGRVWRGYPRHNWST